MMSLLTLSFITLFMFSISWGWLLLRKSKMGSWRPPPCPPAIPFLGHLHLLMRGPPHQVLMDLARKYGPIFSMRFGSVPVIVVSNPESAKVFLKTQDASFASRPPSTAGRLLTYNTEDMMFAPYGDRWRHLRRLTTLELFTPKRIETFQQQRADEIRFMLQSISSLVGSKVDLRQKLKQLAFNMTTQMLMSKSYFGENVQEAKEAEEFTGVVDDIFELCGAFSIGEYLPYLRWLDLDGIEARFKAVAAATDAFMQKIISERQVKKTQTDSDGPVDFVDIMLQLRDSGEQIMQRNTIKGLMINLITAGTDTSSVTAEWAMAELVKQPSLLSKAQDEIAKVVGADQLVEEGHLSQMPFLQAIVKETFRLHPPVPLLPRESMEDCNGMGFDIAAGTTILINVYAIHRDPSFWKDALDFKPERFLDGQVDVRGQDFQLIPFGSGRRSCPAMSLGLIVVQLALANLLHAFDWEAVPGEVIDTRAEKYGLTVPPAKNLELLCHPRLPVNVYKNLAG